MPEAIQTHCPYCSLQCGVRLVPGNAGLELTGREDFPVNRGGLCMKGANAAELITHPDRLTTPLARDHRDAPLRPVGWDDALDRIATGITRAQDDYGRDAVGLFGGGGLTNEKAYALGKFARVGLRTAMIDYNGRFCMSSAAAASNRAFGIDRGLPFPLADVADADVVLLVGSNPADTMPPAMQWFEAGRDRGARHIVVDPRRTSTAKLAHRHLRPVPGTDLALASGMLHIAIRDGLVDEEYVATRTTGFEVVRRAVRADWPDRTERVTGVAISDLTATVHALAAARTAMILTARGAEQHADGTATTTAWINLALALGLPGRGRGSGWATVTGQGNGQGGREHGQKADQLPGYRRLADPADREFVAGVWGVDPDELPGPGLSAYEMLDRLGTEGGVRVLLLAASNPVVSAPNAIRVRQRLAALDLLVVTDFFLSESARHADVVLPTTQFAEEDGTLTNLEGRVLRRRRAVAPPPGVRSELQIWHELAQRLGCGEHFPADPRVVYDELRRASAGGVADYAGISWDRLDAGEELFWPCPDESHPGSPRLFTDRFPTPDGRARFVAVTHRNVTERLDDDYPYLLITGRSRTHYQSGTQTRRNAALAAAEPEAYAELHPELARKLGVTDGGRIRLSTRRGSVEVLARITGGIRHDTVFVPFHWPGVNDLVSPRLDPTSRMPEFKTCAVAPAPAKVDTAPAKVDTAPAKVDTAPADVGSAPDRTPVTVPDHEEIRR